MSATLNDTTRLIKPAEFVDSMTGVYGEGKVKQAEDASNAYTRLKVREGSILRQIVPAEALTDKQLDKRPDTDKPIKWDELEIDVPMSVSLGFGMHPHTFYISGRRYGVLFNRIATSKLTKDVIELRTYDMDIRQILSDNIIKDMLVEEDAKWIQLTKYLCGPAGVRNKWTESVLHVELPGGVTRENFRKASEVMMVSHKRIPINLMLMNNVTAGRVRDWGRDEVDGDMAQEILQNGFTTGSIFNYKIVVTIKRELVEDNEILFYAEPKFLGRFFTLEDVTLYVEKKAYIFEFFAYCTNGAAIGNVAAIARVRFTGTDWNSPTPPP